MYDEEEGGVNIPESNRSEHCLLSPASVNHRKSTFFQHSASKRELANFEGAVKKTLKPKEVITVSTKDWSNSQPLGGRLKSKSTYEEQPPPRKNSANEDAKSSQQSS